MIPAGESFPRVYRARAMLKHPQHGRREQTVEGIGCGVYRVTLHYRHPIPRSPNSRLTWAQRRLQPPSAMPA
eukprot:2359621-Pleurochrysis_carterae.AAC.1